MKAIIVEDEIYGQKNLAMKLKKNCPQVEVVAMCDDKVSAIQQIQLLKPDLVFLDVRLDDSSEHDDSGFQILSKLRNQTFEVIFTSADRDSAVRAFKEEAIDFLAKPINEGELIRAVAKAEEKINLRKKHEPLKRLPIPIMHGFRFINVDEIIYCEADNNRTIIHLLRKEKLSAARTLKKVEEMLNGNDFIRIHRKYLINRDYLELYSKEDGGYVELIQDIQLPVSRDIPLT